MDTVRRARELFDAGNPRAAIETLKPAATRDRPPFEHRLALAELYRDLDCPDQAGRWGIVVDGWTTERERDRLARLLASSGVERRWLRAFLAVPIDLPDPADLDAVVRVLVPRYRTGPTHVDGPWAAPPSAAPETARELAEGAAGIAVIVAVLTLLAVYVIAITGADGARFWAAAGGTVVLILSGIGVGLVGLARLFERRRVGGVAVLAAGLGVVALGVLGQVLLAGS
ncbi:hypothetical protein [Agromyces arachidis]|uniref:hypothetical protein n=1 Tax=Agromyces arachidis TaxID=766966 RepID=UPI0040563A7E